MQILYMTVRKALKDFENGNLEVGSLDDSIRFGADVKKDIEQAKTDGWLPASAANKAIKYVNDGIASLRGMRKAVLARN